MWVHNHIQCLKLRVRPAPEGYISDDGAHNFRQCTPDVRTFSLENKPLKYIGAQGKITGLAVLKSLHPLSAENITLISNTDIDCVDLHPGRSGYPYRYLLGQVKDEWTHQLTKHKGLRIVSRLGAKHNTDSNSINIVFKGQNRVLPHIPGTS